MSAKYVVPVMPFEARVRPEVLAVCRALHHIEAGCDRPFGQCEPQDHEDDADALLAWLEEYDFKVVPR